jgi:3-oxoacyl-[acyl-carrier protein] reductase
MSDAVLAGKIAIVTGGGGGIGQAICTAFARAGAKLVCLDIDGAAAQQTTTACGGDSLALRCDVSSEAETKAAAAAAASKFGGIDILVNAAATDDRNGTILDITADEWLRVLSAT